MTKAEKWGRDYRTIAAIAVKDERSEIVAILFRNHDIVHLTVHQLMPLGWTHKGGVGHISLDGSHVTLPASPADLEVPWDIIRRLSDPEFALEMARLAGEQARHIGARLRVLRERRGMTHEDVAKRTGFSVTEVTNFEHGICDIAASFVWRLLGAMGYTAADLAADMTPTPEKTKKPKASRKQRQA